MSGIGNFAQGLYSGRVLRRETEALVHHLRDHPGDNAGLAYFPRFEPGN